jgi:hypothetical protein
MLVANMVEDTMEITYDSHGDDDIDINIDIDQDDQDEDFILDDARSEDGAHDDDLMVDDADSASYIMEDVDEGAEGRLDGLDEAVDITEIEMHSDGVEPQSHDMQHPPIDMSDATQVAMVSIEDHPPVDSYGLAVEDSVPAAQANNTLSAATNSTGGENTPNETKASSRVLSSPPAALADDSSQAHGLVEHSVRGVTQNQPSSEPLTKASLEDVNQSQVPVDDQDPNNDQDDSSGDSVVHEYPVDEYAGRLIVIYQGTEYSLVASSEGDDPDSYFLKDDYATREPLSILFAMLREVLHDDLHPDDELCLSFDDMGLETYEVCFSNFVRLDFANVWQTSVTNNEVTLAQLVDLHNNLSQNDGEHDGLPRFYVTLSTKPDFGRTFAKLLDAAAQGTGLNALIMSLTEEENDDAEEDEAEVEEEGNTGQNVPITEGPQLGDEQSESQLQATNEASAVQAGEDVAHAGNDPSEHPLPSGSANNTLDDRSSPAPAEDPDIGDAVDHAPDLNSEQLAAKNQAINDKATSRNDTSLLAAADDHSAITGSHEETSRESGDANTIGEQGAESSGPAPGEVSRRSSSHTIGSPNSLQLANGTGQSTIKEEAQNENKRTPPVEAEHVNHANQPEHHGHNTHGDTSVHHDENGDDADEIGYEEEHDEDELDGNAEYSAVDLTEYPDENEDAREGVLGELDDEGDHEYYEGEGEELAIYPEEESLAKTKHVGTMLTPDEVEAAAIVGDDTGGKHVSMVNDTGDLDEISYDEEDENFAIELQGDRGAPQIVQADDVEDEISYEDDDHEVLVKHSDVQISPASSISKRRHDLIEDASIDDGQGKTVSPLGSGLC